MRIFPLALIAVGVFGLLKHFGLIDPAFLHMAWPLLLIGLGLAMLLRGPRWRADLTERRRARWERRMDRHFGPGWAALSDAERERFRAGMRQWQGPGQACGPCTPPPARDGAAPTPSSDQPAAPGQPR
jgi:hypothetical protein